MAGEGCEYKTCLDHFHTVVFYVLYAVLQCVPRAGENLYYQLITSKLVQYLLGP